MTKHASKKLFDKVPYKPTDVQVVELHDCFSANELITYEALGLCEEGQAGQLIDSNNNTYGGKLYIFKVMRCWKLLMVPVFFFSEQSSFRRGKKNLNLIQLKIKKNVF